MRKKPTQQRTYSNFALRVRDIVARIPQGKTLTYTEVARRAGSPKAARAVGTLLSLNYDKNIPCHRVIRTDGTPGGYNRGMKRKLVLLKKEGAL